MGRAYFDDHGTPHPHPVGKDEAKRHKSARYIGNPCAEPDCKGYIYFTKTDKCLVCARQDAADLYAYCVGAMKFMDCGEYGISTDHVTRNGICVGDRDVTIEYQRTIEQHRALFPETVPLNRTQAIESGTKLWIDSRPCSKAGHFGIRTLNGECYFCEQERLTPSPRQKAIQEGKQWYFPTEPCKQCGTIAERRVSDSRCLGCHPKKDATPRQIALHRGEAWYTPTEPCKRCGTLSERNVGNGTCRGCKNLTRNDARETTDSKFMRENPDVVMSRELAVTLGMKVYRTGVPCNRGHNDFRYVSTGSCISCLRRKQNRG